MGLKSQPVCFPIVLNKLHATSSALIFVKNIFFLINLVLLKDYNQFFHWKIIIVDYYLFNKPLSECPGAHYNLCISPLDVHINNNF